MTSTPVAVVETSVFQQQQQQQQQQQHDHKEHLRRPEPVDSPKLLLHRTVFDPSSSPQSAMSSANLTAAQLRALFDILTHYETYREVENFKDAQGVLKYGYPFEDITSDEKAQGVVRSESPLLQLLLTTMVLPTPGASELPPDFWTIRFRGIMVRFGEAELSESYDKQALGTRKTLATAASAIHSLVTRGILGGVQAGDRHGLREEYDATTAEGLVEAWDDAIHELVYGNLLDELTDLTITSEHFLDEHSLASRLCVEYAMIHVATFLHHVLVLSPEGPYLLKLLENCQRLVPYGMIGQTLRVGNAATMINGMMKLFLAKVSLGGLTNWIGLTHDAADGMNLMQRIISMVLGWDSGEFRKASEKVKKRKDGASSEHLSAIDEHVQSTKEQHDKIRQESMKNKESIVVSILKAKDLKLATSLSEAQHTQCLEYYSAQLSIRDRDKIVDALCHQSPDLFTTMLREVTAAIEPMIRNIHNHVDLRKHVNAFQKLLDDLIQTSKPKKAEKGEDAASLIPPSVEDYVLYLRRNKQVIFTYQHEVSKGCPEIRERFRSFIHTVMESFRQSASSEASSQKGEETASAYGAGTVSPALQSMFSELTEDGQQKIVAALDEHEKYMTSLEHLSQERMQHVLDRLNDKGEGSVGSMSGPGIYLSRWQSLLDETTISPQTASGPLRKGKDVKGNKTKGKVGAAGAKNTYDSSKIAQQEDEKIPMAPDVTVVWESLGKQFRELVAESSHFVRV